MRTEEIKIYKFEELEPEIQEKVITEFIEVEYINLEFWAEDWKYNIKEFSGIDCNIHYSLGYCQGDGASIEFSNIKISELKLADDRMSGIKNSIWNFIDNIFSLDFLSKGNISFIMECLRNTEISTHKNSYGYHYCHNKTIECDTIEFFDYSFFQYYYDDMEISKENSWELTDVIDKFCLKFEKEIQEFLWDIGSEIEKSGYSEIEFLTSKEYIEELLEINDYEFTEKGELY